MESAIMPAIGGIIGLLLVAIYFSCIIALIIYLLRLMGRFVSAHEQIAGSLDVIARKMRDDTKL